MKKISFVGFDSHTRNNEIFQSPEPLELWSEYRRVLLSEGYDVSTEDIHTPISSDFTILYRLPSLRLLLQMLINRKAHLMMYQQFEPEVVIPIHSKKTMRWFSHLFGAVLTWDDDLVDNKKFFKFCYPYESINTETPIRHFKERRLITNISGNKNGFGSGELYSKRREFIRFMEQSHPEDFTFYGKGWSVKPFPSYGGTVLDKDATLAQYRFSLCFENLSTANGYITEKIFDCLSSGCVPVYWGAKNIAEYIPFPCYIDFRKFKDFEELYQYIKNMSSSEYERYIQAKNDFATSAFSIPFKYKSFIHSIITALNMLQNQRSFSYFNAWCAFFLYAIYLTFSILRFLSQKLLQKLS